MRCAAPGHHTLVFENDHVRVLETRWCEALPPHSLENVGAAEIRVLSVELKQIAA